MVAHYSIRPIVIIGFGILSQTLWNFEVKNKESLEENSAKGSAAHGQRRKCFKLDISLATCILFFFLPFH